MPVGLEEKLCMGSMWFVLVCAGVYKCELGYKKAR